MPETRSRSVTGTFTLEINEDGEHAGMTLNFPEETDKAVCEWLEFAHCNDIVWRIHAGAFGKDYARVALMGMVRRALYTPLFRHIHDRQFMVPGAR